VLGGTVFAAIQVKATPGLCILSMAGFSALLILFAVNPWYPTTFVIAVLFGITNAMQVILPNAYFQEAVPSTHLGRVISLWFLAAGLAALSALPIGLAGEEYGLRWAFAFAGALFIAVALWFGLLRDRFDRLTARTRPSTDAVQP
jgi:MFS family permease